MTTPILSNMIQRVQDEPYFETVARAITSPMTTATYNDNPLNDYHRLDISEVMLVCANEVKPLVDAIGRREGARATIHEWAEQYIPDDETGVNFIAELTDPTEQLAVVPTRFKNVMAKMGRMFIMSDEAQIVARAQGLHFVGTDEFARQMAIQVRKLVRDTERAILEGVYSESGTRGFRGLLGAYKTGVRNGWFGGVITDTDLDLGGNEIVASGAGAGQRNIEDVINEWMLQQYELFAGPPPSTLYIPPRMLKLVKEAASEKMTINTTFEEIGRMQKYNLGGATGKIVTNFGILNVVAHPKLIVASATPGAGENIPANSRMLLLEPNYIDLVDYANWGGFHIEPRAKNGPVETRLISQLLTLEMRSLNSHGEIRNFWVAPDA